MFNKQKLLISGFILLVGSSVFFQNFKNKESVESKDQLKEKSIINCVQKQSKNISPKIDFSGRIKSSRKINIVSEVNGISKVNYSNFEVGKKFKSGEVLIYIEDSDIDLELKSIKSQFLSLLVRVLPEIKMDFPSLGNAFQSYINNFKLSGRIDVLPTTNNSKERNFLSSRQILENFYRIQSLENKLNKYKIKAPFDGVITKALIDPGANVIVGQPLGEFIDPTKYEISTSVSINESLLINSGDKVQIDIEDSGDVISGMINRKGVHINELTQSIDLFIDILDGEVKDGMYATGKIICDTLNNVYQIPRASILNNNQIFILKDNSLKLTNLDVLINQNDMALVKGLNNNDCIVEKNRNYFYDGMTIN
tara:strand:- start:3481 stop:4581 length:1101 start_codon:yes stop_codon:yes gene_type:complete